MTSGLHLSGSAEIIGGVQRWSRWALTGLLAGLWGAAAAAGIAGSAFGERWNWGEFAIRLLGIGILYPPAWAAGEWVARRVQPPRPERRRREAALALVKPALGAGHVPAGVDPARWTSALTLVDQDLKAVVLVVTGSGVVVAGLVAAAAVRVGPADPGIWAVAVVVLGVAAANLQIGMRRRAVVRRVRAQLPPAG
jgi:hypothetical protein